MHSIGNSFDRYLAAGIRFAYLIGAVLGIFALFAHLDVSLPELTWGFGAMVSVALVVHEFLQTRRVMIYGGRLMRGKGTPEERTTIAKVLVFNVGILAILLTFNGFSTWNYLTHITMHTDPVPLWVVNIIESVALPAFGLVASFLVEILDDAGVMLQRAASDMLLSTTKKAVKQWSKRLDSAVKEGRNLTPIVTALMLDSGDTEGARRIGIIEEGLSVTEDGRWSKRGNLYSPATLNNSGRAVAMLDHQNRPAGRGADGSPKGRTSGGQIRLLRGGRKPRATVRLTAEQRVHKFLDAHPNASLSEIEKGAKVSHGTAITHRQTWGVSTGTEG